MPPSAMVPLKSRKGTELTWAQATVPPSRSANCDPPAHRQAGGKELQQAAGPPVLRRRFLDVARWLVVAESPLRSTGPAAERVSLGRRRGGRIHLGSKCDRRAEPAPAPMR